MSDCKKCGRDIAKPKDKYCGACVHNAYAELEAERNTLKSELIRFLAFMTWQCCGIEDYDERAANRIRDRIYESKKVVLPKPPCIEE